MYDITNEAVAKTFNSYSAASRDKLLLVRSLIIETHAELNLEGSLDETLKWGEPSYLTTGGSTIRIAWKASKPKQYGVYFNCKTKLVDTCRELYSDTFVFEGNRAIILPIKGQLPLAEMKHCIQLALTYHSVKHMPLLGA